MHIAKTGLETQQQIIDQLANDASNASTMAYQRRMVITEDNFYTTLKKGGLPDSSGFSSPTSIQRGSGSKIASVVKIMTRGDKKDTNDPFHLYIQGGGYFAVNISNNRVGYTRVGSFKLNNERRIVTDQGYGLVDDITIPLDTDPNNVVISENGIVTNKLTGDELGQIQITTFPNEQGLEDIGGGIALETPASGAPNEFIPGANESVGKLLQFGLEMSNVSQIEALTSLISAQRAYELNLKIVAAENEMQKNTNETYK
jgi:flagellar basal-body rod protein FlgG